MVSEFPATNVPTSTELAIEVWIISTFSVSEITLTELSFIPKGTKEYLFEDIAKIPKLELPRILVFEIIIHPYEIKKVISSQRNVKSLKLNKLKTPNLFINVCIIFDRSFLIRYFKCLF